MENLEFTGTKIQILDKDGIVTQVLHFKEGVTIRVETFGHSGGNALSIL